MVSRRFKKIFYFLSNNQLFESISKDYKGDAIILCYHRVLPENLINDENYPDKSLVTSLENFEKHLKYLKKKCDLISLDNLININENDSKKFKVCITFDDGYKDNLDYVLPLINKYQVPITIYITTRFLEEEVCLWWYELWEILEKNIFINFIWNSKVYNFVNKNKNNKIKAYNKLSKLFLSENLINQEKLLSLIGKSNKRNNYSHIFLEKNDLQKLDNNSLVTIGMHSHSHLRFSILDDKKIVHEMETSIKILKENLHSKINHFAYPYGQKIDINKTSLNIIRSHGLKSVTTTINKNIFFDNFNSLNLPRYGISDQDNLNSITVKISGFHSFIRKKIDEFR